MSAKWKALPRHRRAQIIVTGAVVLAVAFEHPAIVLLANLVWIWVE